MNKKTTLVFSIFIALFISLASLGLYLQSYKSMSKENKAKKLAFVKIAKLPDLAISTGATFVRHRSLATVFSIYKDDGDLREYFPSTYAISHSHIINKRKDHEK